MLRCGVRDRVHRSSCQASIPIVQGLKALHDRVSLGVAKRVPNDTRGVRERARDDKQSIAISNELLDGACTWIAKCWSLRSQLLRNPKNKRTDQWPPKRRRRARRKLHPHRL